MLVVLRRLMAKIYLLFFIVYIVSSCQTVTPRENVNKEPAPAPIVKQRKVDPMAPIVANLLNKAHIAFKGGHYTTPDHDNAYDTFNSVLMIDPGNPQATSGLQAILLKYAELTRLALSEGRFASAKRYLAQAELYYPANSLILDLKKQIYTAQQQMKKADAIAQGRTKETQQEDKLEEIDLPRQSLDEKSEELISLLSQVALRLRDSKESVLIFARSDKEGRWIYSQLKKAADGYRVRGDIRVGRVTKLRILPPF